jgi:hypothetical protein
MEGQEAQQISILGVVDVAFKPKGNDLIISILIFTFLANARGIIMFNPQ